MHPVITTIPTNTARTVRSIAISHQSASVNIRQHCCLTNSEIASFLQFVKKELSPTGLVVLSTCNRTEIYFESIHISTEQMLQCFLKFKQLPQSETFIDYFVQQSETLPTTKYILEVASGLRSVVVGDMQIINQLKTAYQQSLAHNLQGKILERIMQSVFKMHKRIQNETQFRSGSASLSYLALNIGKLFWGVDTLSQKSLLIVGAGHIAKEVVKYSSKFQFNKIGITNRTRSKAAKIAEQHNFELVEWTELENAILTEYDIVIFGLSNSPHFLKDKMAYHNISQEKILVDLGMPPNVEPSIGNHKNISLFNVDQLNTRTKSVQLSRLNAIAHVEQIIGEEYRHFMDWYRYVPANERISQLKNNLKSLLLQELDLQFGDTLSEEVKTHFIDRLSNQIVKTPAIALHNSSSPQKNMELVNALDELFKLA